MSFNSLENVGMKIPRGRPRVVEGDEVTRCVLAFTLQDCSNRMSEGRSGLPALAISNSLQGGFGFDLSNNLLANAIRKHCNGTGPAARMPEHKTAEALNVFVMSEERHGLPHHNGSSDS